MLLCNTVHGFIISTHLLDIVSYSDTVYLGCPCTTHTMNYLSVGKKTTSLNSAKQKLLSILFQDCMFCSRIIAGLWLLTHHGSSGCGAALHSVESETCNPFNSILREVTRTDQRAKAVKLKGHSAVLHWWASAC